MKAEPRLYVVRPKNADTGRKPRLVETTHPSIAMRHVASDELIAEIPTHKQLIELTKAGVEIEIPGANHEA